MERAAELMAPAPEVGECTPDVAARTCGSDRERGPASQPERFLRRSDHPLDALGPVLVEVAKRVPGVSEDRGGEVPREPGRPAAVPFEQLLEHLGGLVEVIRLAEDQMGSVGRGVECCGCEAHRVPVDDAEAVGRYEELTCAEVPVREKEAVDPGHGL